MPYCKLPKFTNNLRYFPAIHLSTIFRDGYVMIEKHQGHAKMAIRLSQSNLLSKLRLIGVQSCQFNRKTATTTSTRGAEAVFIETAYEVPVIAITDKDNVDLIGPPDAISNLRPIVRRKHVCETELQTVLRDMQDSTQQWNQQFWAAHNTRFNQQRKEFVKEKQKIKGCTDALNAEEMSEFYKRFLDENWSSHVKYNMAWYKRNFHILWLSMLSCLPSSLHYMAYNGNVIDRQHN